MSKTDPFSKSNLFEKALQGILRPLVRALISQGLTAPAFYRIVKKTYVDMAAEELQGDATDSRISVMTGVHRRDVKTFRGSENADEQAVQRKVSTLVTVIGRWLSDPDLVNENDAPKAITRAEFEELVQSVSRDIRPRTVLDELARQNILVQSDDMIELRLQGLVGPANMDQRLHFFSHNIGDHMSAAVENLLQEEPAFLERAVFYNALSDASVQELHQDARDLSNAALRTLNSKASSFQDADKNTPEGTQRFRFGVFFYSQEEDDEGDAGS